MQYSVINSVHLPLSANIPYKIPYKNVENTI